MTEKKREYKRYANQEIEYHIDRAMTEIFDLARPDWIDHDDEEAIALFEQKLSILAFKELYSAILDRFSYGDDDVYLYKIESAIRTLIDRRQRAAAKAKTFIV